MSRSPGMTCYHLCILWGFFYVLHAMLLMFIALLYGCVCYCDDVLYLYSNTVRCRLYMDIATVYRKD